jgi:hypothetical protein
LLLLSLGRGEVIPQREERLVDLLMHIRVASKLADQEARERRESDISPMTQALLRAAGSRTEMDEISIAFNDLTANLLAAGMWVDQENEIQRRIAHAIRETLENVQVGPTRKT